MLTHVPIGPFSDGTHGVGYVTPGCTSKTIISAGMTAARAIEESLRLNEEQEQRAVKVQRDYEHRNRVLGLTPVVDYLADWIPDTPAAFAAATAAPPSYLPGQITFVAARPLVNLRELASKLVRSQLDCDKIINIDFSIFVDKPGDAEGMRKIDGWRQYSTSAGVHGAIKVPSPLKCGEVESGTDDSCVNLRATLTVRIEEGDASGQ